VFLGERDSEHNPLPEFIGARPDDLETLIGALVEADGAMAADGLDPVLHAASIAFGFVYIHPLEDGNGRLHRYLVHHVLAERKFSPPGLVFPVSSSMLKSIDRYREILRDHSLPLMDFIEWETTDKMNVKVLNDTRDLYSVFDCTEACEFLYSCIRETIEKDLPEELHYLKCHDRALAEINKLADIPDNMAKSLILFVRQNNGVLPKKRRQKEFAGLTDDEVNKIERIVYKAFSV
ncbi:MAG: Fic family protein, partial [Victivallales bacterium]